MIPRYQGQDTSTCESFAGEAHFEEDVNDYGHYHFDIHLGPANSRKLINFLMTLGPEPDDDD